MRVNSYKYVQYLEQSLSPVLSVHIMSRLRCCYSAASSSAVATVMVHTNQPDLYRSAILNP